MTDNKSIFISHFIKHITQPILYMRWRFIVYTVKCLINRFIDQSTEAVFQNTHRISNNMTPSFSNIGLLALIPIIFYHAWSPNLHFRRKKDLPRFTRIPLTRNANNKTPRAPRFDGQNKNHPIATSSFIDRYIFSIFFVLIDSVRYCNQPTQQSRFLQPKLVQSRRPEEAGSVHFAVTALRLISSPSTSGCIHLCSEEGPVS